MHTTRGLLAAAILIAAGCGDDDNNKRCDSSLSRVRIGAILAYSGMGVTQGPYLEEAAQMAADDINGAGGVDNHCIEVLYKDNQNSTSVTVSAAQDLIGSEGVAALLVMTSSDAGAVIKSIYLDSANTLATVPVLCMACGAPDYDDPALTPFHLGAPLDGTSPLWRLVESNTRQGEALAQIAYERGYTTAGTYAIDLTFGTKLAESFIARFGELGGSSDSAWQRAHPPAFSDAEAVQQQMLADMSAIFADYDTNGGSPQALVLNSLPDYNIEAMFAWQSLGYPGRLLLTYTSFGEGILARLTKLSDAQKDTLEGVSYAYAGGLRGEQFLADHLARTQNEAVGNMSAAYDAVMLVALAAKAMDTTAPTGEDIQKGLKVLNDPAGTVVGYKDFGTAVSILESGGAINYEGVYGSLDFDIEANNNPVTTPLVHWQVQSGAFEIDPLD